MKFRGWWTSGAGAHHAGAHHESEMTLSKDCMAHKLCKRSLFTIVLIFMKPLHFKYIEE